MKTRRSRSLVLVNAAEMARQHRHEFEVPSAEEIAALRARDVVKIATELERFWVQIESRDGDLFNGTIDNHDCQGLQVEISYFRERPWRQGDGLRRSHLVGFLYLALNG